MVFLTFLGIAAPASAAPSTNADLAGIGLLQSRLNEGFSSARTSYTISVPNGTAADRVQPFAADTNATITVNGTTGGPRHHVRCNFHPGRHVDSDHRGHGGRHECLENLRACAYTRAAPINANLGALALSSGSISPSFSPSTVSYTATVANAVDLITVTPTVADVTSTVTVNGTPVTSGTASGVINLSVGTNAITVTVTAQNGTTTKTYTVNVTRSTPPLPSSDAKLTGIGLSGGSFSPTFSPLTTSYTGSVPNSTPSVRVIPYASHPQCDDNGERQSGALRRDVQRNRPYSRFQHHNHCGEGRRRRGN